MPRRKKDVSASYNALKTHQGKRYTGMKVGGHHKWYYEKGVWKEEKVAPDRWEFRYESNKHRAGRAPEGSGAPVGTKYHWFILGDQEVAKLDANTYSTLMEGVKYKVAHRRASKEAWSASDRARQRKLIAILEENAKRLRAELEDEPTEPGGPKKDRRRRPAPSRSRRARRQVPAPSAEDTKSLPAAP